MPRKELSFKQRQAKIARVAETEHHSDLHAAQRYLAVIEGASVEEQMHLFRLVLTLHDAARYKRHQCPTGREAEVKQLKQALERLGDMVNGWARTALQLNATAEDTAKMLWDRLTLCEAGSDRLVALGLLLRSKLVPYAQIPPHLTLLKPQDVYDEAYDRVVDKIALLKRIEGAGSSPLELAEAFVRVLEQIGSREEKVAILYCFFRYLYLRVRSGEVARDVFGKLESMLSDLGHFREDDSEEQDGEEE